MYTIMRSLKTLGNWSTQSANVNYFACDCRKIMARKIMRETRHIKIKIMIMRKKLF